ncbi:hypothetical protein HN592_06050 [Candidatus Woesearchaeota archaeon]|jgi:radical SAM superfamily enzyme YgiQ (UPF0313 family)|nr:hypothetical protein [Candidatus Woesearchaeota archaeon]MBT3304816.1 hypothetical protein [Candidatus Woesearchaeota archaeon]MBT4367848.1 hypothetical protein [Candidatus Woesearchaeota archaeon]MBT4712336.1 hypothetical protein [Candidatus Woesearchaeota archaeon]MBT6639248.1 hypothetical protein [Candidatus Woesearchaeota archaeon]
MLNVSLVSFYHRLEEYPSRYSLAAFRLAAHNLAIPDVRIRILPVHMDESPEVTTKRLNDLSTDLTGMTAYIWTTDKVQTIANSELLANPRIVIGGPEVSALDICSFPSGTQLVSGEGEDPLRRIILSILTGQEGDATTHKDVVFPSKYTPIYSEPFMPALTEFEDTDKTFTWHDTSVGCAYNCGFCGHRIRQGVQARNLAITEEEIKGIGRIGFNESAIIDPILAFPLGRDKKILEWYTQYAPDTKVTAYYRSEVFNEDTINLLASTNMQEVIIGLQTLNPCVPSWLRSNDLTKAYNFLPQLSQNGIPFKLELIIGLPGDDYAGQRSSLQEVIDVFKPNSLRAYPLTVIKNTKLAAIVNADATGQQEWVHMDQRSRAIASNSYSQTELNRMVIFASALTSLYNVLKPFENVTFSTLERRVLDELGKQDPDTMHMFRRANDKEGRSYWKNELK